MKQWSRRQWLAGGLGVSDSFYLMLYGVPNTGKTRCGLMHFLEWSLQYEHKQFALLARKQAHIDNHLMPIVFEFIGNQVRFEKDRGTTGFWLGSNYYHRWSGADKRQAEFIQGANLAGAFVDEASLMPIEVFEQVAQRVRSIDNPHIWMTSNPPLQNHWLHRDYMRRAKERGMLIYPLHFSDNPVQTAEFVKRMAGLRGHRRVQMFEGKVATAEGLIYTDMPIAKHVPANIVQWVVSVDPTQVGVAHALLIGEDKAGDWWVADEWWHDDERNPMTQAQQAASLVQFLDDRSISPTAYLIDPANPNFSRELEARVNAGMDASSADYAAFIGARNAVEEGIYETQYMLGAGKLRLTERTPRLLEEVESYSWDPAASRFGEAKPLKVNDHGVDALRYFAHTMGA